MRVIFLDIDGVMRTVQSGIISNKEKHALCPIALSNLHYLVNRYELKIAVSSTLRNDHTIKELEEMIKLPVLDITPFLGTIRGVEIESWLKTKNDITDFIILDDGSDMGKYLKTSNFICCNLINGLTWSEVQKAVIHLDKFNISFKDVKIGNSYRLLSKPFEAVYRYDGKDFRYNKTENDPGTPCVFYEDSELFSTIYLNNKT